MRKYTGIIAIKPIMDKRNTRVIGYLVKDEQGEYKKLSSNEIKQLIKDGVIVKGLHLSKDGRLLRDKGMINHINIKTSGYPNLVMYTGMELIERCKSQSGQFNSRDFVHRITEFCTNKDVTNRVMLIHGIRRTGKTTSIHHSILQLANNGDNKLFLIEVNNNNTKFDELYNALLEIAKSIENGIVFIDEITNVIDIVDNFSKLSDQLYNLKIVASGTDSYVFPVSYKTTLFGRAIIIHSTMLSYAEYKRLIPSGTLASYISDGSLSGQEFMGNDRAISAINSAIIGNVISTLTRNKSFFKSDSHVDYKWLMNLSRQELAILIYSILTSATEHKTNNTLNSVIKTIGKTKAGFIEIATGIPQETIPKRINGISNFTINSMIRVISEIDIIRQMSNLTSLLCSDEQLNNGYEPVTDKSICVLQPGLLSSMLHSSNLSQDRINGIEMENLVSMALYCCRNRNNISISNIGYVKYIENCKEHEIDVVAKIIDSSNNVHYTLIEVKHSTKQKFEYIGHLVSHQLPERLLDKEVSVVRLVVYNGKTGPYNEVNYVNIEDFIINPWNYII